MTASAQSTVTGGKAIVFGMTVLVFAMMAVVAQLPMPMQESLLAEGGPFETLSVVCYGLWILLAIIATGLILLRRETWGFIRGIAKGAAPLMFAVAIYLTYRLPRLAAAAPSTAP